MVERVTRADISRGLAELGVRPGAVVVAHASLSALGTVVGGEHSVCLALADAVGSTGTVVMPGFSPQLVHPAAWRPERLAGADADALAAAMPPFDPASTPVAATIGAVAQCLRATPGTERSPHPHTSFLARGPRAAAIVAAHPLRYRLSSLGPLGQLWKAGAQVILLGVPWSKCSAIHLAEYEAPYPGRRQGAWAVPVGAGAPMRWAQVPELLVWEGDFDRLGAEFETAPSRPARRVRIGAADCLSTSLRDLARFAAAWLPTHRDLRAYGDPPGWSSVRAAPDPLPIPPLT
jgi:aminoglycoside 3-N-acetyltransferase